MLRHKMLRTLAVAGVALALGVQGVAAETVLKLGTVGRLGMPIGDAIDQALIPTATELSGGKVVVEPHYRGSLCGEQKCGEQANQGLLQLWTSSTANFGNFGTALAIFDLPYIFKSIEDADAISEGWMSDAQCQLAAETTGHICFVVYSSGGFRELGKRRTSGSRARRHEGREVAGHQEPDRVHPDQELGCGAGPLRLDSALPGPSDRRRLGAVRRHSVAVHRPSSTRWRSTTPRSAAPGRAIRSRWTWRSTMH